VGASRRGLRGLLYESRKDRCSWKIEKSMDVLGIGRVHATLGHDCGISMAILVLESRNQI